VYDMRLCFLMKILKSFCCSNSNFHSLCPRREEMQDWPAAEEMQAVKHMWRGEKKLTKRVCVASKYGRTTVLVVWENQQKGWDKFFLAGLAGFNQLMRYTISISWNIISYSKRNRCS
jgi:hypothetical protein